MKLVRVVAGACLLMLPPSALSQDAQTLLNDTLGRQSEALNGVDIFVVRNQAGDVSDLFAGLPDGAAGPCLTNCTVYKVEQVVFPDGETRNAPRALSPLEVKVLLGDTPGADLMEAYGLGMIQAQKLFNKGILTGDATPASPGSTDAGFLFYSLFPNDPWLDPLQMFATGGRLIVDAAQGLRAAEQSLATSAEQAQSETDAAGAVMGQLEDLGVEEIDGIGARYFGADLDLPPQTVEDQTVGFDRAEIWVDPADLVVVKHRIEGTATAARGQSREFFIEVVNSDFRGPATCDAMYKPHRRTVRIGGILDDEQMAEMEEARRQLEEFDRQMASMPPGQRRMVENMMGSQMDTVRSLADSGAIEHVEQTEEILCDPDLAALFGGGAG